MSTRDHESTDPIQQYVDGEIFGDELQAFEERLRNEPELRARVEAEKDFVGALGGALAPQTLSSGYGDEIRALIGTHWPGEEPAPGGDASRAAENPTDGPAAPGRVDRPAARRSAGDRRRPRDAQHSATPKPTPRRWARHPLTRVAAIAATLLIVVSAVSLLRDDSTESRLPWIISDSIGLFERALGSPARAAYTAPPENLPPLRNCKPLHSYCEGKRRDGKLNRCILFESADGIKLGLFCLDDRVDDEAFFEREPFLEARGFTVVRCGPPGALHIWVAKGLDREAIIAMIEPDTPAKANGDHGAEIHVESMACAGCAYHIVQILKARRGITEVRCNVEQRTARVWFDESVERTSLVDALIEVGHQAR